VHSSIYPNPIELLQRLIRFDTTNPPGNEAECIAYASDLLNEAGISTSIHACDPHRPNLVARLPGRGSAPPLLLYGHVDVVTTADQTWRYPPFEGRLVDGYVWGRGALDMKGGVAMQLSACLRAKAENLSLPGDVILTLVSDEEAGSDYGAKFLVEKHPDLFDGVRYALSEFGGFSLSFAGQCFYPIMVAEKQICWMKATFHGQGGHASMPVQGGAMAAMARVLLQLDRRSLPVHVTPAARLMFEGILQHLSGPTRLVLSQLLNPALTDRILALLGERSQVLAPLLHNTVSPTILHASDKINVIPGQVILELDGRLLPGYTPADMLAELSRLLGGDLEIEVLRYDPGPAEPDMGLFDRLAESLRQADPQAIAIPMLGSGVTDARFFSRLGIQTYGFTPMNLSEDYAFTSIVHAADERIPAEAMEFGTQAIYQALQRFG
jgi:acetylornithine deacetylase/succinyl-diaminopimelate desuccinylase-like protein